MKLLMIYLHESAAGAQSVGLLALESVGLLALKLQLDAADKIKRGADKIIIK